MPIRGTEDKTELDKERLRELAFVDDLTELYNRRYLYQYLPSELKAVLRLGKELSLFMIDVDNFKQVNDTYGHLCGDKVLVEIAEILRQSFRQGDTVIRYAGDEFVAILPGAKEEIAVNIAKRIVEKVDKNRFREKEGKSEIHLTLSIGLAVFPRDAQDPEKLIYQADRALYSSKRSGRNRIGTTEDITAEILDETILQEILPSRKLIGRNNQLDALKELLDEAEKGKTKLALIKGGRGIGKTRLIDEFKRHAQLKGITNINASCAQEISTQPYQILVRALENLFASLGPEVREFIRSLPEAQTRQLANYIPTLRKFLPEGFAATKAQATEQTQSDFFKGVCQSLIYIVKRNTLLLVIDDFQWIDKGTLQLFNYIMKDLGNMPMLIVAAYRPEEMAKRTDADSAAVRELLKQAREDASIKELTLGPLEKDDVLKMITAIFTNIAIVPGFVDIIFEVSLGNPLFTEEVLRSLVNKGLIYYQDGKWQSRQITVANLPPFLKEAIAKRIAALDEETKPVVSAAAVMGEVFDFDILCQVLQKNLGFVLEAIDRAAKQHLVVPQSPFQTDKFKFSSEAIRDVIYGDLGVREKQDLHRKLALIEEVAYKDNLDPVAGSLGYHFGKAQDTEKANLYANVLLEKAKRMPTYEDVFGFLQDALLEKVEEIVVPLSNPSMKLVPAMVRSLRLTTQNVRLYPPHSTIRKGFVDQAYKYLTDILDKDSTLIISTAENRLLINGEEVSVKVSREAGSMAFVTLMIDHRIKSIIFKKGLTNEHLVAFFEGLSQSYDDLIAEGGLSGVLRKKDISLIRVNEVGYEQTTKLTKQRTKFQEAMLIDYLIGKASGLETDKAEVAAQVANDPKKLGEALKKVAEATKAKKGEDKTQAQANIIAKGLQKLSEQLLSQTKGGVEQYRKNIAQAMMALDYKLRSKLIQAQVESGKTRGKDVIKDAVEEFSDEEILKMVAKELVDSGGNLRNLRNLINSFFLDSQRRQKLVPKLKQELAKAGLSEEATSWVLGEEIWQGLSLKDKLLRALGLNPENYVKLQTEVSEEINKLISQLLDQDRYGETAELIDKLLKQLENESKEVRKTTIKDLENITEMLILKKKFFLLEQIFNSLIVTLDKEKDPELYYFIIQSLATNCTKLIKSKNFIQATGILREFNIRLGKTSKLLDIQKQATREAKDKTVATSELISWLTRLLEEKIEGRHDFWELSKVVSEIGPVAIGPIFALAISKDIYVDPFKVYALRWSIAKVFKGMGDEAVAILKDRLSSKDLEQVITALELLGHMQNKTAVRYLTPLLKHEDLDVRKEAIATLGKTGGEEAIKLLSTSIKDKNSRIRLASIWALANIGTAQVLPILKPLLKDDEFSYEVQRVIQRIKKK